MDIFTDWRQRRLWPIYIEQILSILWAFAWFLCTLYLILTATSFGEIMIWFTFTSFALVLLSHIQLIISLRNDSRYDNTIKYYLWAAWYPALYWMINTIIVIAATPKAIMSRIKGGYATWSSPDRGKRSNQ